MIVLLKMYDSVPSTRYSPVCIYIPPFVLHPLFVSPVCIASMENLDHPYIQSLPTP